MLIAPTSSHTCTKPHVGGRFNVLCLLPFIFLRSLLFLELQKVTAKLHIVYPKKIKEIAKRKETKKLNK
jgi:hypothetical protein